RLPTVPPRVRLRTTDQRLDIEPPDEGAPEQAEPAIALVAGQAAATDTVERAEHTERTRARAGEELDLHRAADPDGGLFLEIHFGTLLGLVRTHHFGQPSSDSLRSAHSIVASSTSLSTGLMTEPSGARTPGLRRQTPSDFEGTASGCTWRRSPRTRSSWAKATAYPWAGRRISWPRRRPALSCTRTTLDRLIRRLNSILPSVVRRLTRHAWRRARIVRGLYVERVVPTHHAARDERLCPGGRRRPMLRRARQDGDKERTGGA